MTARILVVSASLVLFIAGGLSASSQDPIPQPAPDPAPLRLGPGITHPRVLKEVRPVYTREAMQARIQGEVALEVVILRDGTVGDVRVLKSLDSVHGLDDAALAAARKWLFEPATWNGLPVAVYATLELGFRVLDEFGRGAYRVGTPGLVAPKPLKSANPEYTPAARAAGLQGTVEVEVVVLADGTVGETRIRRSLDKTETVAVDGRTLLRTSDVLGLDQQAIGAAKQWTFEPATLNGKSVPMITTLTFEYRLR